jgi:hypothetical protein
MKYENAGERFPYSVADTLSGPIMTLPDDGTVRLEFTNYRNEAVLIIFDDVLGFKYQSNALDESGWAEDLAIEVIDSEWLRRTCEAEAVDPMQYRHLIIGFNERQMVVEILFATLVEVNKVLG